MYILACSAQLARQRTPKTVLKCVHQRRFKGALTHHLGGKKGSYEGIDAPAHVLVTVSVENRAGDSPGQPDDRKQYRTVRYGGLPHRSRCARPITGLP